jgi:chromosome segregation ATPase
MQADGVTMYNVILASAAIATVVSLVIGRLLMPAVREHLGGTFVYRKEHDDAVEGWNHDLNGLGAKVGEVITAVETIREIARNASQGAERTSDRVETIHRDFEREIVPTLKELNKHMSEIRLEIASYNEHRKNVDRQLADHEKRLRHGNGKGD